MSRRLHELQTDADTRNFDRTKLKTKKQLRAALRKVDKEDNRGDEDWRKPLKEKPRGKKRQR